MITKKAESLLKVLQGLAFDDKGNLCKKLFDQLLNKELKFITN